MTFSLISVQVNSVLSDYLPDVYGLSLVELEYCNVCRFNSCFFFNVVSCQASTVSPGGRIDLGCSLPVDN